MKVPRTTLLACLLASIVISIPAADAKTWNVPSEVSTIQGAINCSSSGDTVGISPGNYNERLSITGKSIVLRGEGGADSTTLSGLLLPASDLAILTLRNVDSTCVIEGLRFKDGDSGFSNGLGGALSCRDTCWALIQNNVFEGNKARYGGAITTATIVGCPTISANLFLQNEAYIAGGAISADFSSSVTIAENQFIDNKATGGGGSIGFGGAVSFNAVLSPNPKAVIRKNIIYANEAGFGGGIRIWDGTATVEQNTIVENRSNRAEAGRAAGVDIVTAVPVVFRNNIVAHNQNGWGVSVFDAAPQFSCNDFWQNELGNYFASFPGSLDFSADPMFCDIQIGNFSLSANSPCAAENSGACGVIGAQEVSCGQAATDTGHDISKRLFLIPNYPNPFTSRTTLSFQVPATVNLTLTVFDISGKTISELLSGSLPEGRYEIFWDGTDSSGREVAAGVYFVDLVSQEARATSRIIKLD